MYLTTIKARLKCHMRTLFYKIITSLGLKEMWDFFRKSPIDTLEYLLWRQTKYSFVQLDKKFLHAFQRHHKNKWDFFALYVDFLYIHGDLLDNLDSLFADNLSHYSLWTPLTKIRYISWLLLKNQPQIAQKYLQLYASQHGTYGIDEFLTVANLAHQKGITSKEIEKTALAYQQMEQNKNLFKKLVQGKKVALVGNGPQELGSHHGPKIDSYDVVIRFNEFEIAPSYAPDYGTKTTIWASGSALRDSVDRCDRTKYFMYVPTVEAESIKGRLFETYNKISNIFTISILKLRKDIYKKTGIYCASTGLHLIYAIKGLNSNFTADDCFGFSFKEKKTPRSWVYVNQMVWDKPKHSLGKERDAIQELLNHQEQ